jgi:amino acid transporter
MVELMTASDNKVMKLAYTFMRSQYYGESSAMLWSYFAVIGIIMAICLLIYTKLCIKKWE